MLDLIDNSYVIFLGNLRTRILFLSFCQQNHRRDRIIASDADRDLSVDRPDVEDEKSMIKVQRDQKKRLERDNRDRINREQDDRESGHDNKDLHLQRSSDKRKSARKVEGFGMNANVPFADDKNALKSESIMKLDGILYVHYEYLHFFFSNSIHGILGGSYVYVCMHKTFAHTCR